MLPAFLDRWSARNYWSRVWASSGSNDGRRLLYCDESKQAELLRVASMAI